MAKLSLFAPIWFITPRRKVKAVFYHYRSNGEVEIRPEHGGRITVPRSMIEPRARGTVEQAQMDFEEVMA